MCGVGYSTEINSLSEPIDVYSEWIGEACGLRITLCWATRKLAVRLVDGLDHAVADQCEEENQAVGFFVIDCWRHC